MHSDDDREQAMTMAMVEEEKINLITLGPITTKAHLGKTTIKIT